MCGCPSELAAQLLLEIDCYRETHFRSMKADILGILLILCSDSSS